MDRMSWWASPAAGGLGYIVLAAVVLALGDGLVKIVSHTVSVWQLIFIRSVVALPLLWVLLLTRRAPLARRTKNLGWLGLRSVLLVAMWILVYLALTQLSLPSVSAALYSAPVLITVMSALAPGRRLGRGEIGAVALGFVGVLVLLRPGTSAFSPMLILPLVGAVFYALAAMLTASHCREESPLLMALGVHMVFLFAGLLGLLGTSVVSLPASWQESAPFVATGWHTLSIPALAEVAPIVVALAVIAVVASAAMARAYQMAPAPLVAAGDYSYLVFSALWSLLLFSHVPDLWAIGGMLMIAVAGVCATGGGSPGAARVPRARHAALRGRGASMSAS
ncbi:DMT family transporter [Salinisphaera sp. SPP-AMP-43]|uniref:DMT family transporter n=1 Tax=Salinisphaera sp. SPP-AMP-43 TaxID=3121288 RepID=UPI003C6EA334